MFKDLDIIVVNILKKVITPRIKSIVSILVFNDLERTFPKLLFSLRLLSIRFFSFSSCEVSFILKIIPSIKFVT